MLRTSQQEAYFYLSPILSNSYSISWFTGIHLPTPSVHLFPVYLESHNEKTYFTSVSSCQSSASIFVLLALCFPLIFRTSQREDIFYLLSSSQSPILLLASLASIFLLLAFFFFLYIYALTARSPIFASLSSCKPPASIFLLPAFTFSPYILRTSQRADIFHLLVLSISCSIRCFADVHLLVRSIHLSPLHSRLWLVTHGPALSQEFFFFSLHLLFFIYLFSVASLKVMFSVG